MQNFKKKKKTTLEYHCTGPVETFHHAPKELKSVLEIHLSIQWIHFHSEMGEK